MSNRQSVLERVSQQYGEHRNLASGNSGVFSRAVTRSLGRIDFRYSPSDYDRTIDILQEAMRVSNSKVYDIPRRPTMPVSSQSLVREIRDSLVSLQFLDKEAFLKLADETATRAAEIRQEALHDQHPLAHLFGKRRGTGSMERLDAGIAEYRQKIEGDEDI